MTNNNGLDTRFVHFWAREVSDKVLQREIDLLGKDIPHSKQVYTILLEEKLRRAEQEIYIHHEIH